MSNINEMGKWVLGEINNLGFELSEDDFQTSLTDDKSVNWYYETIKGNGYELGSVEEFKSSLMPEEKSERLRARELRKQSRQSYKDAMAAQKGMPKEKQSIGDLMGNTSQAQMFAQYAEKDRIARETADREEQAYLNAGMTERDKEARKELEKLNNPVSVWADGTFHVNTKVPVNGEFGMPTRVDDSNPVLTEWKEEKKAQMPSYVTREENSTSDIVNNTYERALNTTEGKELYIMLRNAASEDFHKTDEYKKLVKDLSMGMATEEDFIKIFNEKYGKQINEDFWEGITSQGGVMHDYYNAAWRKLNEKATAEGVTGVEAQIDEYYRQKEEDFENKVREEYKKKYGVYPEDDKVFRLQDDEQYGFRWGRVNAIKQKLKEEGKGEFQLSTGGTVNLDKDWVNEQLVRGAKQFSDDARKMIDAAVEEKGFFKGVGDAATDVDTFDMGLSQLIRNTRLMDVVKKVEADESLSKEEQLLMDSALNYFATSAYYSDKLGRWYKAGTTTAASMPFMIQFMLSSGALAAIDSATKTGVSAAMKGLTHAMVKWGKKKAAKTVVSSLSGLVSSVVGAAAVTALWSPAKIAAGGVERQIGDIKPELDGDAYTYGGRENAQSAKEAYLNSFADAYIENLSEMVLANTFDPLKTYIKGTNLFGKISKNDVFDFLYDVRTSPVMKTIREKAKFGGLFEEMMEEELGGLLRWGVMSDVNSAEEAGLDLDGQIDIFLGLAPTSLLFSSTGLASHYGRLTSKSKEIRKSLATEAQRKMFDELMKESRSGIFGDQAHDFIRDVVMNDKMSIEQKKAALEVVAQQYSDVLSEELNKQVNTVERERYDKTVNEFVDRGRYGDTQRVFITTDAAGHNVLIVGGHVEFMDITEGGVTQRVVDVQASDANLQIRKNFGDGRLGEIETVRAKFLNRLVSVVTTAEFKHFKQTQFNADIEGKPTFEYSGHVFDTETGKNLGKKDEYEKEQKKVEDKVKSTNNEKPKANTKEHKIKGEFTLKVDGKNKKVEVYIKSAVQKEDGSLDLKKSGKITIMEGGMVLQGTRQEDYVKALSEHLKQEHEKAVQEFEANNQPAVQPTPIVSEADVEAAKAEEANAAKEAELDAVRRSYPYDKQGNIDIDKLTPEQLFVFENDREGRDIALETVVSELNGLHEQLSAVDTNEKLTSESQKKKAKYKLQDAIKVYEDIIIKYEGQEALDAINAARIATPIEQAPAAPVESPAAPVAEPTPAPEVVPAPEVLPEPEVAPEVEMEEQIEDTPVEEEVAEEVAAEEEVPVAEVPAREPIDLSSDNIVFVKQAHRVAIAERGEDGVLRFVDNGKVVGDTWMEMPNKILVYYNGQPCYALTTVSDPKYFSNEVNIVSKDYIGNVMKVSRWDLTNEDGKKLLKTGAEIQEERVNSKYKSIADFLNTVIYTDVKNNIKLTLRELFAIPVIDANRGRLGAPSYRFQVERFIENQSSNREDKAIRDEIRKHLQELVQDWNAYVKINNLTDVVDEENMSSFYSAMKQQGGYKSNGLLVQTQDFSVSALNSADITKNPVLQLAVVLDQASELGMLDENIDMSAVDNFSSIKQKLAEPSEMTTEDIQQEMKDIELERAKSNNSVLGKNRYNKLKRELNKRANTNPTDVAEPAQEPTPVAQGMSKSEQRFVDMLAERDFIVEELNQGRGDMQRLEELNRVLGILGVEPAYPNAQVQETEIAEEVIPETTAEDEAPETIAEEVLPEEETEEEVPTQQVSAETIKREIEKLSERLGDLTEEQEEEFDAILAQIQEKNALLESIGEGYKEEKTEKPKASQNKPKNRGIDNFSLNRDDMAFMVDQQVQESAKAAKVIINLLKKAGVRVVEVTEQQIEQMVGKDEYKKLTADGVVYGTAHKGIIYLNSEHLNPNTPLHEFTHLWVDWYKNEFKEEWERFVKLAVKSKVAKQLKTKDAYKNLSNDDLASEVLSHYTGYTYGAMTEEEKSEFENLMNTTGSIEEQIAEKPLRKAIRNFWKRIISIFDKTILDVKEEESIDDMIRRFSKLPMLTLIQGEEAVAKFMTGKSAENLDNSKKSSNFAANNENYERTEEFRELQERSLGLSQSRISEYQSGRTKLSDEDRRRVGGVFQRLMESDRNGGRNAEWINLTGKGSTFKVAQVNPAIFHDVFQICRNYLPNGELVDLHNYYANCKCFISEDGLCGFAIEPDGNLVSVFSLNPSDKRGFLYAIKDLIRQEGATHLDCYVSNKQPLAEIYEKALGFHVASEMDYNMKYDHDNIAENHGMPKVAFMVDRRTEKRNFDGESYNAASEYQQSQTSTAEREQIVAEAKSNGTYMLAPNGQPTNLTEDQWVTVRTQAFKDYFGDWQNDTANASVVVDENGEPMVVYHGSRMAGFDKFGRGEARDSQGIYTTPNRRAAESYATSSEEWKSEQTMPEAEIGVSDQHGVYSLFVNMRNPKTIDFGGKRFDEYGETKYEVATNEALDNGERGIIFDTLEEAEAYIAEHPEEDLDYVEKRTTSDELLVQAKEEGYDGVIFTNIIDSRYPDPITNYVPFESNQVKSATQNIGTFNAEDDRIQFMVGPTASNSDPTLLLDTEAINRIKIKSTKAMEKLANPNIDLPKELGGEGVAKMFDRTEGIRRIMNSIAEYRKENGKPKMGEGFDVRTMVETMDSKINNQKKDFDNNQVKRLQDIVYKFCAVIEKSKMYKDYKREQERNQSGEPVELTPVQFLERYLIACDSIEREVLSGNPRGMGDFLKRMGVTVIDFHNEFRSEFAKDAKGKQMIDELWEAVRGVTRVSLEVGVKSGLISQEEFERQSQRQFYVPERDYAEVEANKELWIEGASWRRSKRGNRLRAMQHAEGGKSLAANVLANMLDLTYDAIAKAEMNKVKVAMFDLLSNNEDWCRANKVPIPITVWYEIDGDGNVVRKSDEPTRDERDEMRRMKSSIRRIESSILDEANKKLQYEQLIADNKKKLTGKLTPAERAQIENDIQELKTLILECEENIELANQDIDNIESSLPYVDSVDARNLIFETKEQSNAETVIAFIDGAPCEMHFPNMVIVADCLNNVAYRDMYFDDVKKWTSYVSAIFTVYNPTFFTVNIARDVIWTLKTGYAEYGWQFPFRFAAKLAAEMFTSTIWKAVAGKDYSDTKHATHMKEFFEGGGNTGYTQLPEMQRIKKSVAEWGKKKRITWGDVGNVLSFMNEWSEVWTRSAAYSVVRDMGYNQEEGIRAAKNLSVNFNRKGLGHPFINFFSSFSMFANATIQGACGFYRKFKGNEDKEFDRFLHTTRAIMSIALTPALAGFFSTLMNPDDEEDYMVTDYDRDNNMVFGNIRIPLSEQIKPFWVIGVNIALGMQGKRNSKDIARSIINSFALNLMPFPNSFNSTTQMVVDSALGYNTSGLAGAVDNLLTPQILKQTNGIANNRNFFGGKLRFDIGDIPEYTMGDNEPYLYRKLAEIAYYIGGGDENLSSRTVRKVDKNGNVSYETLGRAWDLNPKEIEAWANSFVPSGIRDIANVAAWAIGRAKGDDDAEIKLSELSSVSRFYKPQDKDLNRYMLIKQARDYVKPYQEHIQNVDKSLKGGAVVGNEGRIDSAKQRKVELESNFFYVTISKLVEDYNKVTTDKIANKYNLEEKDVRNTLSTKRIEELDARRDELLRKIVTLMREKDEQELYNVDTGLNKTVKYTEQDKKDVLGINLYNSLQREKKNRETRK